MGQAVPCTYFVRRVCALNWASHRRGEAARAHGPEQLGKYLELHAIFIPREGCFNSLGPMVLRELRTGGVMSWNCACKETTLNEVLDDPMTVAVMRRDGVDRQRFEELMRRMSSRIARTCAAASTAKAALPCAAR